MRRATVLHGDAITSGHCRDFGYEPDDCWAKLPPGWSWREAAAVATDRQGRVYVFNRGEHPVIVLDRDGTFLAAWGEGIFTRPHGIFIGPDNAVYCTDDQDHTVRKFTPDGQLLLTLGVSGRRSDTGATSVDYRTILRAGPPFHYPTNLALAPKGICLSAMVTATRGSIGSRPMAGICSPGASRGTVRVSSECHMGLLSMSKALFTWPTARTVAFNSLR